jgi:hypothetical protein
MVSCSKNQKQIIEFRDAFDFFIDCKYCPLKTKSSSFKVNIIIPVIRIFGRPILIFMNLILSKNLCTFCVTICKFDQVNLI